MPPTLFRRLLTFPGTLLATAVAIGVSPVAFLLSAVVDAARGTTVTRAYAMAIVVLLAESAAILAVWPLGLLPERVRADVHHRLQRRWNLVLLSALVRIFRLRIDVEGEEQLSPGPLLLFGRHASTADSVLPMLLLAVRRRFRMRYVLKEELRWDPAMDIVGPRLRNVFVRRGSGAHRAEVERVGRLAQDLESDECVVLFPESTRFSAARRDRLRLRDDALGEQARALQHVLPPRPAGAFAMVNEAPRAAVLILAHRGLEGVRGLADALDGALLGRRIEVRLTRVPHDAIPRQDPDAFAAWLFETWQGIDAWVDSRATGPCADVQPD